VGLAVVRPAEARGGVSVGRLHFRHLHCEDPVYTCGDEASTGEFFTMHSKLANVAEMAREKTTQFNMRMTRELKEAAEEAAADDQRSLASLIDKLLTDYCRERGFLKPEKKGRR
jgi:hypothetical protein